MEVRKDVCPQLEAQELSILVFPFISPSDFSFYTLSSLSVSPFPPYHSYPSFPLAPIPIFPLSPFCLSSPILDVFNILPLSLLSLLSLPPLAALSLAWPTCQHPRIYSGGLSNGLLHERPQGGQPLL